MFSIKSINNHSLYDIMNNVELRPCNIIFNYIRLTMIEVIILYNTKYFNYNTHCITAFILKPNVTSVIFVVKNKCIHIK